jgi:ABC-type multidrug transport system fused ATPase/permease subunit
VCLPAEDEMRALQKRLEETEAQMTRILQAMQTMQSKMTTAAESVATMETVTAAHAANSQEVSIEKPVRKTTTFEKSRKCSYMYFIIVIIIIIVVVVVVVVVLFLLLIIIGSGGDDDDDDDGIYILLNTSHTDIPVKSKRFGFQRDLTVICTFEFLFF